MTDQNESASENAELLAAIDEEIADFDGAPWLWIEARDTIRALEAKVREKDREIEVREADNREVIIDLRNHCDRLAGEVERLKHLVYEPCDAAVDLFDAKAEIMQWQVYFERYMSVIDDEFVRLTAELAAARENEARYLHWRAQWLDESEPTQDLPYAYYTAKTPAELDAAIDAARRAGGEG